MASRPHRLRIILLLTSGMLLIGVPFAHANDVPVALTKRFIKQIQPLLNVHCVSCHSEESAGGLDVLTLRPEANRTQVAIWLDVREQLELGFMPPRGATRIPAAKRQVILDWILDLAEVTGKSDHLRQRMLLPEHGNRVNHELLFSGEIQEPAFTPARYWRIRPRALQLRMAQDGHGSQSMPFGFAAPASGIQDFASQQSIGLDVFQQLQEHIRKSIERELQSNAALKAMTRASELEPRQVTELIKLRFQRATGRQIRPSERERFESLLWSNVPVAGNEESLKLLLMAIELSTESVFRREVGTGKPDEHGRRMLSPNEIALALAHAFGDQAPMDIPELAQALRDGSLKDRRGVEIVVRKMIDRGHAPPIEKLPDTFFASLAHFDPTPGYGWYPRVIIFFDEFFQYSKAAGTFKDSPGKTISRQELILRPQGLIAQIVNQDERVFEELLTSARFNRNTKRQQDELNALYQTRLANATTTDQPLIERWYNDGLEYANGLDDEEKRRGILSSNSWLIAHSSNNENQPIHRGIWIRTHLLAGVVPELPVEVDAIIPEAPHKTLRERHAVTQSKDCSKCHRLFDPLGLPFEDFDDRGWGRDFLFFDESQNRYVSQGPTNEVDKTNDIKMMKVDATGFIEGTGEPGLDGAVRDSRHLVEKLAKSRLVRQSIIRHAFRFWMGRNELLSDSTTLMRAERAYNHSGGKFSEVLISLLTSDSFLYRKDSAP